MRSRQGNWQDFPADHFKGTKFLYTLHSPDRRLPPRADFRNICQCLFLIPYDLQCTELRENILVILYNMTVQMSVAVILNMSYKRS
jgi:hypothetical protein